jgi:hypothetical protein
MEEQPNPCASPTESAATIQRPGGRTWYFAALALFVLAVSAELISKHNVATAIQLTAQRSAGRANAEAGRPYFRRAEKWTRAGMMTAVVAAGCWILSGLRRERVLHSVPLLLLGVYVLLLLLVI